MQKKKREREEADAGSEFGGFWKYFPLVWHQAELFTRMLVLFEMKVRQSVPAWELRSLHPYWWKQRDCAQIGPGLKLHVFPPGSHVVHIRWRGGGVMRWTDENVFWLCRYGDGIFSGGLSDTSGDCVWASSDLQVHENPPAGFIQVLEWDHQHVTGCSGKAWACFFSFPRSLLWFPPTHILCQPLLSPLYLQPLLP